jgi:pantoate--beta-alanine ligase
MSPDLPEVIRCPQTLYRTIQTYRAGGPLCEGGRRVGLVPTMGALHEGHLSLARCSQEECDATVATIFVNPMQFGPNEDLSKYPRTLNADLEKLATCGVRWVFVPDPDSIYPPDYATDVTVRGVAEPLEGECRPGHFQGVATIVLKLFNMAGTDVAYFGQKDYQQAAVISRMAEDLNVPIEVRVCPIIREPDGLAMSSRNAYLDVDARQRALVLIRSLRLAERMIADGERDAATIHAAIKREIETAEDAKIDYIALADPGTLAPVDRIDGPLVAVLAVVIGGTRLIDNVVLDPNA